MRRRRISPGLFVVGWVGAFIFLQSAVAQNGQPNENATSTLQISVIQAFLLIAALAACITCIWMVFFFGRRLQTSAYLRESLVSATKEEELRNLLRELDEKRRLGPIDPEHPPPEGFELEAQSIWPDSERSLPTPSPSGFSYSTPEEREERLAELEASSGSGGKEARAFPGMGEGRESPLCCIAQASGSDRRSKSKSEDPCVYRYFLAGRWMVFSSRVQHRHGDHIRIAIPRCVGHGNREGYLGGIRIDCRLRSGQGVSRRRTEGRFRANVPGVNHCQVLTQTPLTAVGGPMQVVCCWDVLELRGGRVQRCP